MDEQEKNKSDFVFEDLAFSLVPSGNNNWGTYYGPQITFKDQNENIIEEPALDDITIDAVLYWEQRYKATNNPLLTMTYAGLVWDFKLKVCHEKKIQISIENMLIAC